MQSQTACLQRLITPQEYQSARHRIFPSEASLDWHMRTHRSDLMARGALVRVTSRNLIDPEIYDEAALEFARRKLAAP